MSDFEKARAVKSRLRGLVLRSNWDGSRVIHIKDTIYMYGLCPIQGKSLYLPYIFEGYRVEVISG